MHETNDIDITYFKNDGKGAKSDDSFQIQMKKIGILNESVYVGFAVAVGDNYIILVEAQSIYRGISKWTNYME